MIHYSIWKRFHIAYLKQYNSLFTEPAYIQAECFMKIITFTLFYFSWPIECYRFLVYFYCWVIRLLFMQLRRGFYKVFSSLYSRLWFQNFITPVEAWCNPLEPKLFLYCKFTKWQQIHFHILSVFPKILLGTWGVNRHIGRRRPLNVRLTAATAAAT